MHDRIDRPVLVTGASSGIGYHLAKHLTGMGYPVYATARSEADIELLGAVDGVTPITLDVRNPEQIDAARRFVNEQGKGLHGLVNNAGIGPIGGFSTFTDQDMLEIFDVNVFGPHRTTNAFLSLLLESHGRIVNIGSQGGSITGKFVGPYTMTKHALEAYTEALAAELRPHGVRVSIVQPGGIVSRISVKSEASNSADFVSAMDRSLELGTRNGVRVESPTLRMTKAEIAVRARELGLRRRDFWSCYRAGPDPCGCCEACARSAAAWAAAGAS